MSKKGLSTIGVFSLGAGAMISSGLFILPSVAFSEAGVGAIISYLLAGICMLPAIFTKLELTSAIPKAGGAFFYLTRIFGAPVGMISGLAEWFSIALKSAFALIGIGVFGSLLFPTFGEQEFKIIALCACVFFTVVNIVSVEGAGRFQVVMVFLLLLLLAAYILVGYRRVELIHLEAWKNVSPMSVLTTTGMVFISYGGITKIAAAVEEIRDPKRMLVPGLLSAFFVVQLIYLLVVAITIGIMDANQLAASVSPLTDAAHLFFDDPILKTFAVASLACAGLLSFFTTANAGILSAARVPFAMSRDGMLPTALGVTRKNGTPVASIVATGLFMVAIILGLDLKNLAKVASLFLMLVFLLENLGLIVMRASRISNYRPIFRAPLFPALQIVGIAIYGALIVSQGALPLAIAGAFTAGALLWYFLYARKRWSRTSAFISMIEKTSGPDFADQGTDLEQELLSILLERDNIVEDQFDTLVRNAAVIDYDHTVERDRMFGDVAKLIAERHNLDPAKIERKFSDREELASTLIYPGIAVPHAIPHAIIEGTSIFDMVLVRSRFGIQWPNGEVVYTAFCLVGSKDQRDVHLKTLMSIAQTLQDPQFPTAWHEAKNAMELRSVILLTARRRG